MSDEMSDRDLTRYWALMTNFSVWIVAAFILLSEDGAWSDISIVLALASAFFYSLAVSVRADGINRKLWSTTLGVDYNE